MWVDRPAFRTYDQFLSGNLAEHGIDRVVFVNAHGGNVGCLYEVGRQFRETGGPYPNAWMWDETIPDHVDDLFLHNGPNGGPKETAMIQHLHPAFAHVDRLDAARYGGTFDLAAREDAFVASTRTFSDNTDISENGVLWRSD